MHGTFGENRLFVGYPRLEEWLASIDPNQPVYASPTIGPSGDYLSNCPVEYDLCVVVAQPDWRNILHYCRLKVAVLTMYCGEPFDGKAELKQRCLDDVWRFVREWLKDQSLTVRLAVFDRPRNFTSMAGSASFLRWDRAALRYVRTDKPETSDDDQPAETADQAPADTSREPLTERP